MIKSKNFWFFIVSTSITAKPLYLYAIPDYLPKEYSFTLFGKNPHRILWVGYKVQKDGKINWQMRKKIPQNLPFSQGLVIGCEKSLYCLSILTNPKTEKIFFEQLKKLPTVDEIQFDWEYLHPQYAMAFTQFLSKVRNYLPKSTILSSTVFPQIDFPEVLKNFPDFKSLLNTVDFVYVMLYDRHGPNTQAGCVTPLSWLKENLSYLSNFQKDKIVLGAPLYGYCFSKHKLRAITKSEFFHSYKTKSEKEGCYEKENSKEICYYPSPKLYETYENSHGFAGTSFWRAGFEK